MAATTVNNLTDTTFVINAWGQTYDKTWPHFRVLLDGTEIGQGTAASTTPTRYSFTTKVEAGKDHKFQVVYDNDGSSSTGDRNLYVKSVEVNGKSFASTATATTYDRYAIDGKDVIQGQEGMWWDGGLTFAMGASAFPGATTPTTPATGSSTIVLKAHSDLAAGQGAHVKILVDGRMVGETTVNSTTDRDYTFKADITPDQAHKVQFQFDNDWSGNGQDRNLHVSSVSINGHAVTPKDAMVSYDRFAMDGQDVKTGTGDLFWNGTLVVNAPKDFFHTDGSTPTTPPTNPPPTTGIKASIADISVNEPGMSTGGNGIAPGFLHTDGNQIVDSAGNNVRLSGVNWSGSSGVGFAPNGLWLREWHDMMDQMKDLGFNTIRLDWSDAMLDPGRSPNNIDYYKNPDLKGLTSLQVFDKIIDYAQETGMKIILDHHRNDDGAGTNTQGVWYSDSHPESNVIANWKMLAARYAGNDAVIGADLHNEPHGEATWGDGNAQTDWAAAAERIGNAIQSVNKDWLMIVEGVENYKGTMDWWGGNLRGTNGDHEVEFNVANKLVYSVHSYGQGVANWGWFSDPNYPNNLNKLYTESWGHELIQNDTPIFIGEMGGRMETANEKQYMQELTQYMNGDWNNDGVRDLAAGKQGASFTWWCWTPESTDTGGILNSDYTTVDYNKYDQIKGSLFTGSAATPQTTEAVLTVKLAQAATGTVTLDYATADGTAKAGSDYKESHGTLTFAAGETAKQIKVTVYGDNANESAESFNVKLTNAKGVAFADDTAVVTIANHIATTAAAATADTATASALAAVDHTDTSTVDHSVLATTADHHDTVA
jgi:endoglucanase